MVTKRKLLLADDSITIQKVVNLTFADEGIEVIAFGNGSLAIEQLDEVNPDLVLADVHMPGLNGYEVCEKVKQSPKFSKVPVMLLVGSFEPFDEKEASRVGADDYLTKPFQSIKQLINKVTALLDHNSKEVNETAPLNPVVAEEFQFDNSRVVENTVENSPAETSFEESKTFGEGLKTQFADSGMDDNMIETNSFNWFTPKPANAEVDFETVDEKVDEKADETSDVSYQATYENPPIEVNQTVPLSYSDVQEITANSGFTSSQNEWSVADKNEENPLNANQNDLSVDDEPQKFQNKVDITNERSFNFEPTSIPKDDWRFDDVNDNSWKISPPKLETQKDTSDFYSSEIKKNEFVEPNINDFDATMKIEDEDKPLEYKFEDEPQNIYVSDSTTKENQAKDDDLYKPQTQQNTQATENTILEIEDGKSFDFSFMDDDSILDIYQEPQEIKTEIPASETGFESKFNDENVYVNPHIEATQPIEVTETIFEPAPQSTDNRYSFETVQQSEEANDDSQTVQTQENALSQQETVSQVSENENARDQENQSLTPSNFGFLSPIAQNQELEKTSERQISQTRDDSFANFYFTPEIIDAIAQRVVEKISDKVIEKIAWEIVPDRFDLIVKKQIEERNRES